MSALLLLNWEQVIEPFCAVIKSLDERVEVRVTRQEYRFTTYSLIINYGLWGFEGAFSVKGGHAENHMHIL